MRMSPEAYESLLADMRAVVEKLEETGAGLYPGRPFDRASMSTRDLWDILMVVNTDRSHDSHPRHDHPGLLPRVLDNVGRPSGWLWDRDGEDLDDSHIETAMRRIALAIAAEPPTVPSPPAP